MNIYQKNYKASLKTAFILTCLILSSYTLANVDISPVPLSVRGEAVPPLNMIVMGRDHTLYYEAYNDASDLNGDGELNIGYEPDKVDYYGYFDSDLCYSYASNQFKASADANNKMCSSGWSGDFLNYITTARIDALRKVLYGGNRVTDTDAKTVLERSYIPQDAHSWGKEYRSIEHDGYDIRNYTPLSLPSSGTRHLFANTTLLKDDVLTPYKDANMEPLMRVLTNSRFRIWEWVAIERHVAGSRCIHGGNNNNPCVYSATNLPTSNANSHQDFLLMREALTDFQCGSDYIAGGNINTSGSDNNPFTVPSNCGHSYYLTNITGQFNAQQTGTYEFAVNGDDAVEFEINGVVVSHWYGGHGASNNLVNSLNNNDTVSMEVGSIELSQGWHNFTFRHEEQTGGDNWQLLVKRPGQSWEIVPSSLLRASETDTSKGPVITTWTKEATVPASSMSDYVVRVEVCDTDHLEENCQQYPEENYKPVGLLQDFGKNDQMLFGLITGSYTHPYNMRGGLLRKNIDSISDEIDPATGVFTTTSGIIDSISKLRVVDFDAGSNYQYKGGWLTDKPMSDSSTKFPDWGNPVAEMLYESLRYFTGEDTATSQFSPTLDNKREKVTLRHHSGTNHMFLPAPDWIDPYEDRLWCTPSAQLIISDVNPSYDTEFLPGSSFNSGFSGDLPSGVSLNVTTEADAVWSKEYGSNGLHFIGESGSLSDGVPTAKTVTGFGNIRGLSPAEPTKEGGITQQL
ncbi:PA14 domain-containing protein [Nitrincola sp. A-D6]|uniref:PA14 domain-containing protein n=1 Tax=Nitrincola sp. A-D6 TaxID=1545442 RepID=UPI0009DE8F6D|nr:PA14 domain-containing protein [Nitrincola sp. A-D6]